jgi:hypothetical protein
MKLKALKLMTVVAAVALGAAACGKANPAQPSSTNGGSAGTSYTAPGGIEPADKALIAYANQPVFMVIRNSVASSGEDTFYSFEVATDPDFKNKVFTRDHLNAEQGGGVTHQAIDARLPGNKTYYWHTKVTSGSSVGPFGPTFSFSIGPEILVQPPVPASPSANGKASGAQPTLTTVNAARSGPATKISYLFQVSDSASFGNVLFSGSADENPAGQTSITVTAQLAAGPTYYWRVQASDASGVKSDFSSAIPFTILTFDPNNIHVFSSPPDLGQWPETAHITSVVFTDDAFEVDFDRRDGPNRWGDFTPPGWDGPLQYTLGLCGQIAGQWDCSGVVEFWYGRELSASGQPWFVYENWFFDGRWGPLHGYQPQDGETVALFAGTGDLRGQSGLTRATCPTVCERTDFHMVTWHNGGYFVEGIKKLLLPFTKK